MTEMETSDSILNLLKNLTSENSSSAQGSTLRTNTTKTSDSENTSHNTEDVENSEEISSNSKVGLILSVYWKRGKLGAASYNFENCEVSVLNDITDVHPDFVNLKILINQCEASQLVTCGDLPDSFVNALKEAIDGQNEEHTEKIFFMSSKKKDLGYDACKRFILSTKFGFEPETLTEEDHKLFVYSHLELSNETMVISLGMLLKYLEIYLPRITLDYQPIRIMLLNQMSLENLVTIDETTYKALQIFKPKVHPSVFMRDALVTNREGLSLFGIFNRCKSKIGLKRMRQIFMSPSKDLKEIENRLDSVQFFFQPQHQHITQNLLECIKKIGNVTVFLANIYWARAKVENWRSLYISLNNAILIGKICETQKSKLLLFEKISQRITNKFHEVLHFMDQIIDFKRTLERNSFTVRSGVHKKLDLLRQKFSQIPEVLLKIAKLELKDLPNFIKNCSIIYITELGYLLSVPVWAGDGSRISDYSLPNMEAKFIVNKFIHYKTRRCAELDVVLGDSIAAISTIESKIMVTLIQYIHKRTEDIVKPFRHIAELDCVIALATVASENNYRRPIITNERKLKIVEGRHPLQELCVDNFVTNDVEFGLQDNFIKILTGPNSSGKSVFLKQVGLIVFMAHIGSFVPAHKAEIGITDHIFSRIQSVESVSTKLSAFLIDLKQISLSMYNSTPRSLIIIDEFGKGTTEVDGLSLFAATIHHFIERGTHCPYILASTHFHRLPSLLPPTPLIHLQFMEFLIENNEIIYLYKIKDGTSNSSLTHLAAKAAGIKEDVIERGLEIMNGSGPLMPNPKLKVTKKMIRSILTMEKVFELFDSHQKN